MNRRLDAVFITDDNGALGFAVAHGMQHVTTRDLLKTFVRSKRLDRSAAWHYVLTPGGNKRRYEELRDQDSFYVWWENPGSLRFVPWQG